MASSLRTKLRIASSILGASGFWDALAGRFLRLTKLVHTASPPPPALSHYSVLRGALHVHTATYSDGAGTIEDVMGAAARAGVDFVLLTDHNTMRPKADGLEERYLEQTPFLIVGDEITVRGGSFLLALDLPGEFSFEPRQDAQVSIDAVLAAGGVPLVSLPFDMKHPWESWETTGCAGIEVLNLSTIARRHINLLSLCWLVPLWRTRGTLAVLKAIAARPDDALDRWDTLLSTGEKHLGIGSLDAHALMKIGKKKYPIPSYEESFNACTTHVLVDENHPDRRRAVTDAITQGRCYFVYDCLGELRVSFEASDGTLMGGEASCGISLHASASNKNTVIQIYKNKEVIISGIGHVSYQTTQPGAYRVEVYQKGIVLGPVCVGARPWAFTNPIYIR